MTQILSLMNHREGPIQAKPAEAASGLPRSTDLSRAGTTVAETQPRSHPRLIRKLQEALGDRLCTALEDPCVVEIMLNPDGKLFIERLGLGMALAGEMPPAAAELVIGAVAHALKTQIDLNQPIISGELPIGGHRFEGLLPPVVTKPSFTIRRRASQVIPLDDYVRSGAMEQHQADTIRSAISSRLNIIISGGTGSGKTTLANAVLAEIAATAPQDRLVILEDTAELQCLADNTLILHTSDRVDMARLLKSTMRLRPDRIVVGEVRDGAALTLLKAWNTGHPGGLTTIHANTAMSTLRRLEQLTSEVSQQPMREVIGEAVDLIISIERSAHGRRVCDILRVERYRDGQYDVLPLQVRQAQEAGDGA
nr:P-type conjugative transfer ATPase TrbB [Rhizobium sp. Q54]